MIARCHRSHHLCSAEKAIYIAFRIKEVKVIVKIRLFSPEARESIHQDLHQGIEFFGIAQFTASTNPYAYRQRIPLITSMTDSMIQLQHFETWASFRQTKQDINLEVHSDHGSWIVPTKPNLILAWQFCVFTTDHSFINRERCSLWSWEHESGWNYSYISSPRWLRYIELRIALPHPN